MIKISSSVLSVNNDNFEEEIKDAVKAGVDYIHIDVMDGKFVNNYTNGLEMLKKVKKATNIALDVHLMVENPQDYIDDFLDANFITFHVDAVNEETAKKIIKKLLG
jgi:ribulose-phosphate 3-epimerase